MKTSKFQDSIPKVFGSFEEPDNCYNALRTLKRLTEARDKIFIIDTSNMKNEEFILGIQNIQNNIESLIRSLLSEVL
jgi:hypothetical protein